MSYTTIMVETSGLRKNFGNVKALAGLDLSVPSGIFGLIGPNGAGKTTLLRILLGLIKTDTGSPSSMSKYPTEDPNWFRSVLKTLDYLLDHGWSKVDTHTSNEELNRFARIILHDFSDIEKLQQLHVECKSFNVEKLELDNGQNSSDAILKFNTVFDKWLKTSYLDEDWLEYERGPPTKTAELSEAINKELKNKYNLTLDVLHNFGEAITKEIKTKLEPEESKKATLIGFREEHLIERLYALNPTVNAYALIKELRYKPRSKWMRAPFVRLTDNSTQRTVYFPLTFAFYPDNVFAAS